MSKHTLGPWQVSRDDPTTLTVVAPWSDKVRPGCDGWGDYRGIHTATITHHSGDGAVPREHAEANARLIAAAPDLLEALRFYVEREAELHGDMPVGMRRVTDAARAAIAKATEAA